MNFRRRSTAALLLGALLVPTATFAGRPAPSGQAQEVVAAAYHERVPLGIIGFFARPARRSLYLMSTARSALFQGWRLKWRAGKRTIETGDGSPVRQFPQQLSFRVTASAMLPELMEVDREMLDNVADVNQLLLSLGFRLKIFHGLEVTTVNPDAVDMIGMPADVPYEERVYHMSFTLPRSVPIEDRLVLEVLNPEGDRLCKFHLEF